MSILLFEFKDWFQTTPSKKDCNDSKFSGWVFENVLINSGFYRFASVY